MNEWLRGKLAFVREGAGRFFDSIVPRQNRSFGFVVGGLLVLFVVFALVLGIPQFFTHDKTHAGKKAFPKQHSQSKPIILNLNRPLILPGVDNLDNAGKSKTDFDRPEFIDDFLLFRGRRTAWDETESKRWHTDPDAVMMRELHSANRAIISDVLQGAP